MASSSCEPGQISYNHKYADEECKSWCLQDLYCLQRFCLGLQGRCLSLCSEHFANYLFIKFYTDFANNKSPKESGHGIDSPLHILLKILLGCKNENMAL